MILDIIDSENNDQPILSLSEDENGVSVVGGDAKLVSALGLDKMQDLKEIASFINDAGSNLQAMFQEGESPEEQDEPGEDNATMDERIGPALEIIKDLLKRVQARKEQEEMLQGAAGEDGQKAQAMGAEIMPDQKPTFIYVSVDGDSIGNAVARAEDTDDEEQLSQMSARINAGQDWFRTWAMQIGGQVIESGGDEGLAKVPSQAVQQVESLRVKYADVVGATLSVGIGSKISESTKARMLAKLRGKDQVCVFDQDTLKELDLRMKDQDQTEANKIRTAMQPPTSGLDKQNTKRDDTSSDQKNPQEGQTGG